MRGAECTEQATSNRCYAPRSENLSAYAREARSERQQFKLVQHTFHPTYVDLLALDMWISKTTLLFNV
jgi:hypothetical protein